MSEQKTELTQSKKPWKLSEKEQLEMARCIAWFWKREKIVQHFKDKYKKVILESTVDYYRNCKSWASIIEKFRNDYLKRINDVPLANKRKRLDELTALYEIHMANGDLKEARAVLRDFRDECEVRQGDISFNFTNINHTEFHDMNDEQIAQAKAKALEQYERARRMRLLSQGKEITDGKDEEVTEEE